MLCILMLVSTPTLKVRISIGDSLTSKYGATTGLNCSVDPEKDNYNTLTNGTVGAIVKQKCFFLPNL